MAKLIKIPSAFTPVTFIINKDDYIEFNGKLWEFKIDNQAYYPRTMQDLTKYYPLVIKYVKEKLQVEDKEIAISLPAEDYIRFTSEEQTEIKALQEKVKKETGTEIKVFPQGVSALIKIIKEKGLDKDKNTLVIDGGFNTVNTIVVDENMKIIWIKTYHNEIGIRNLLDKYFYPLLSEIQPTPRNLQTIKRIFLKGKMDVGLEEIDITPEKNQALSNFIPMLFEKVIKDISLENITFDQIAIVGGLSYYVPQEFVKTNKKIFIPRENGEFYTVMGMYEKSGITSVDFGFGDIKICLKDKDQES
jgi:hypothetical protein